MAPPSSRPLTAVVVILALVAATTPTANAAARTTYLLDVPGRLQFEENGGYCGESTLQQLMLPFGVWLPQQYTRNVGGGELLPGVNYALTMDALKIRYNAFTGSGGYRAFASWAKKQLMPPIRAGVVTVAYLRGEDDRDYDHIMPIVGIETSSPPSSFVYSPTDVFYVNTDFSTKVVKRTVGDYYCTSRNKKDSLEKAGCVPSNTAWGYGVVGPKYAPGIGPAVALSVPRASEPAPAGSPGETFNGTLKVSGLTAGKKYKVLKVTSLAKVPASATDTSRLNDSADLLTTFTAGSAEWTTGVSFMSNVPAWFICIGAA